MTKKARLEEIFTEMIALVNASRSDAEGPHYDADKLLVEAAALCGVPREIIELYQKVDKWYG